MSLSPQFERVLNGGESAPDSALIREQLRRLLAHPLFTNSKRYPVLLAYTVEQTLDGNAGDLKERTIGIEAFGREPDYDVNLDPVVRITAAEVRKRLVQYYYNPDHAGELIIEMPVGSYVPSFRETAAPHASSTAEPFLAPKVLGSKADSSPTPRPTDAASPSGLSIRHWILIGIALLLGGVLGFGAGHGKLPGPRSNLQRFWAPTTTTWGTVTYCIGQRGAGEQLSARVPAIPQVLRSKGAMGIRRAN